MSNTLTGLIPVIYEALDTVAREQVGFIPAVQKDATADIVAVGQTITSPVVPAATAADIVPGVNAPNTGSATIGKVNLSITKSRAVPVLWNGEEQKSVGGLYNTILRDQIAQAFRTLANEVEADLAAEAIAAAGHSTGTAGTTPFGTKDDLTDGAAVAKSLDDAGAPAGDRSLIVNSATMANFRGKQSVLFKVNESGDAGALLRRGQIGELHGFAIGTSAGLNASAKNIGFHKNSMVLLARAPAMPMGGDAASDVVYVTDPVSGLTFQVAMYKMYRQVHIEIGLAWGTKCVKPEFVTVLLG